MPNHDAALALYVKLGARGLTACPDGGRIIVTPASHLTPDLREAIRDNRESLVDLLQGDIWSDRQRLYGQLYRGEAAS